MEIEVLPEDIDNFFAKFNVTFSFLERKDGFNWIRVGYTDTTGDNVFAAYKAGDGKNRNTCLNNFILRLKRNGDWSI